MTNQAAQKNPLDQVKTDDASIVDLVNRIKAQIVALNEESATSLYLYEAILTIIKLHAMNAESLMNMEQLYDMFLLQDGSRNTDYLIDNIENLMRRAACLSVIEELYFTETVQTAEGESVVCPLDWHAQPNEYAQQFGTALHSRKESSPIILLN